MHRVTSRSRIVAAGLVLAVVAVACSADLPDRSSEPVVREAAAGAIAAKVASVGFQAFGKIKACTENRKIGQPCLASDGANIRQTLKEVKELRAEIVRNQQQVLAEFDAIRELIRDQNIKAITQQLRPMVINTELAAKAYEALSECATTESTTCRPFIGRDNDPLEDVATAIEKTNGFFLEVAGNLPSDLPVTASWFTGSGANFDDGLADAIWTYNKGQQDAAAGVTDLAVKNSRTVPVLTPALIAAQNEDLSYWTNVYGEYAFLAILHAGLTGGDAAAERRQALADARIIDATTRDSVMGEAAHYSVPETAFPGVVVAENGRAWLVSDANMTGTQPLRADDVAMVARAINSYSSVDAFKKVPKALPTRGYYFVQQPVETVKYTLTRVTMEGIPIARPATANWLTASSSTSCPAKVWPMNEPQGRPGDAADRFTSRPAMVPADRLLRTWEQFVKDKPIQYEWSVTSIEGEKVGWGAWVVCGPSGAPVDRIVQLLKVPPVMAPVS